MKFYRKGINVLAANVRKPDMAIEVIYHGGRTLGRFPWYAVFRCANIYMFSAYGRTPSEVLKKLKSTIKKKGFEFEEETQ